MTMVSEIHQRNSKLFQLSAMPKAEKLTMNTLKIKISRSIPTNEIGEQEIKRSSYVQSCSLSQQSLVNNGEVLTIVSGEGKKTTNEKEQRSVQSVLNRGSKRGPVKNFDNQMEKKRRINSTVSQQCAAVLKVLMSDHYGWVFNQPVDPVVLKIPDYFSVISKPMDLGTIKSKLQKKLYTCCEEFSADVRLTFSNAMLYNPPENDVHIMAKRLNDTFESKWKVLEAKWSLENSNVGHNLSSKETPIVAHASKRDDCKAPSKRGNLPKRVHTSVDKLNIGHNSASKEALIVDHASQQDIHKTPNSVDLRTRVSMTSEEKQKLRKDLMEISKTKLPSHLVHYFQKFGLVCQNEGKVVLDVDALDDDALDDKLIVKLQAVIKSHLRSRFVESDQTETSCGQDFLLKDRHKGTSNINGHASSSSRSVCINSSSGNKNGNCSRSCDFTEASSEVDSEKSSGRDTNRVCHAGGHSLVSLVDDTPVNRMNKRDTETDGAVRAGDEGIDRSSFNPTALSITASGEGCDTSIYDGQLSPSKALRAAMLRSRFAGTIVKAQQKALLNNGEKIDLVKMKMEKERLERQQREERARIEAKIRADEAALRMREEAQLKMQREREREAARIALEKIEKTVEICENLQVLKDLELLAGDTLLPCFDSLLYDNHESSNCGSVNGVDIMLVSPKPLERLGLFLKEEYLDEEDEFPCRTNMDVEEGEIA